MIIDVHTHTFPDKIAAAAVEKLQSSSHTKAFANGTVSDLRLSMARAGIDVSISLPVATNARQVPHINDAAIRAHEARMETGVDSFGGMHPDYDGWAEEMERLCAAGIRGIKLHPPYQQVDFDDERYLRVLRKAAALRMPVLIHAGKDVGLPGAEQATPEKVRRALDRVPDATLILAHMGGWRCWETVEKLLPGYPVYLDTSFALGSMLPSGDGFYKTAGELAMLTPEGFMDLVRAFGPERILFGSDCPWSDQAEYLARVAALPLTEDERAAILGGNAEKLLFCR